MTDRKRKFQRIILLYPVALIGIALAVNLLIWGVEPILVALPSKDIVIALAVAGVLLLANHTWLMTSTELVRLDHDMQATPEEWEARGAKPEDVAKEGWRELERRHNAHRNATENSVIFIALAAVFALVSPPVLAAQLWLIGFATSRLGYSYCYLRGLPDLRGLFMSLGLISLYGMASYMLVVFMTG